MHRNDGPSPAPLDAADGDGGEDPPPAALLRVYHKLRRMSGALGEIDDYFDSRPAWLGPAAAPAPLAAGKVTLENLDAHIRREGEA